MAQQDLEKHYDVIVTGTDLTSSLVAAAVSRAGKKVLHLDPYDRYGQEWAAMKLFDVLAAPALLVKGEGSTVEPSTTPSPPDSLHCVPPSIVSDVHLNTSVFEDVDSCRRFFRDFSRCPVADDVVERFQTEYYPALKAAKSSTEARELLGKMKDELSSLNALDNAFSIDLTPRFLFSLGEMVNILIRSNVTRYLEFRKIARILTPLVKRDADKADDFAPNASFKLINVPCTRNDVFKSTTVSMVEKRLLMRFLDFIKLYQKTPDQYERYESMPFDECLAEQKLTPKLADLIVNSVLMDSKDIATKEALERINRFMSAIGRFADRPYLIPTYGTDDLVQAFCRYAAIYGATYCLNSSVSALHLNAESKVVGSVATNQQLDPIECDFVVTNYRFPGRKTKSEIAPKKKQISRAILCSRESICQDGLGEYDNTSVLYLPRDIVGSASPVYVFETDKSTNACPKGLFIQFFWCESNGTALDDLKPVIEKVYAAKLATPAVAEKEEAGASSSESTEATPVESSNSNTSADREPLWSLYFNQSYDMAEYEEPIAPNLFHVSPPITELDYDFVVHEARRIFETMFPGEEFFPETKEPSADDLKNEEEEGETEEKEAKEGGGDVEGEKAEHKVESSGEVGDTDPAKSSE